MLFMVGTTAISLVLEGWLVARAGSKRNQVSLLAAVTLFLITFSTASLLVLQPSIASASLLLSSGVRIVNCIRIAENRLHVKELRRRAKKTFFNMLLLTAALLIYIIKFDSRFAVSIEIFLFGSILVVTLLALSVLFTRFIYRYRKAKNVSSALPTVSVCIPARNETAELPHCIESVLASTYQKLEIIVLDDCSHDKTPDIIKRYAHSGVRFVNGKEPREDWLAKNAAYDRLADEATGEVLLFIGTDVRLKPDSIHQLVSQMSSDEMISVLPKRALESEAAVFIQPLRYWWELGLWRFSLRHPPVLSTCWAIKRSALSTLGTFESVKKAIEPEAVFARKLSKQKKYMFLVANEAVGIESGKKPFEQYQTALRKRYPQVRRRPETALLVMTTELLFILLPFVLLVWFLLQNQAEMATLSLLPCVLVSLANAEVYKLSLRKWWPIGFFTVPFLVLTDCFVMIRSLYGYEFSKILWKERNVCLPLLSVEKSLPKLTD